MRFDDLLRRWNGGILKGAQTKLADVLDVDRGTISRWATGTLVPGEDLRVKAAKVLNVSVDELMWAIAGRKQSRELSRAQFTVMETAATYSARMKIAGNVSAEKFDFSFDYDTGEFADVDLPRNPGKRAAILRVNGDCMEPKISDGDLVVVVEASFNEIPNGGLSVIRLNGEHTLKRVYRVPGGIELRPDNKTHKTIRLSGDEPANVVGSVRWIIRRP